MSIPIWGSGVELAHCAFANPPAPLRFLRQRRPPRSRLKRFIFTFPPHPGKERRISNQSTWFPTTTSLISCARPAGSNQDLIPPTHSPPSSNSTTISLSAVAVKKKFFPAPHFSGKCTPKEMQLFYYTDVERNLCCFLDTTLVALLLLWSP